ncbi:hypothetical protein MtrunA17_Chr5g0437841 [Medicago truncatula]|uniref:Uncharacterized protein n=1 Tax=Medicago truncatula TaxID=3880 RepID=G7K7A7_MEDTR|nr:hypothetical protein MTR_5g083660 [Medicago truncatula]RHN57204.1 hypothetical protein MtrunA17_Chr5g0437841 [Medicago truncatula]
MELLRRKEVRCALKGKLFSLERTCFKKRKVVLISAVPKRIARPEEEERETSSEQTNYKKSADTFIDHHEAKKILANRRRMKNTQIEREAARLKLEQIKNTACFSENMDSMHDIHKLMGVSFICCY